MESARGIDVYELYIVEEAAFISAIRIQPYKLQVEYSYFEPFGC